MSLGNRVNFGKPVRLADAGPGRVLIQKDIERGESEPPSTLFITTSFIDPNHQPADQANMAIMLRPSEPSGLILSKPWDRTCWDVTDCAEVRPDLSSHHFTSGYGFHGEIALADGGLIVVAHYANGRGSSGILQFGLATGNEVKPDMRSVVRFDSWRLVIVDSRGNEGAPLFNWPIARPKS